MSISFPPVVLMHTRPLSIIIVPNSRCLTDLVSTKRRGIINDYMVDLTGWLSNPPETIKYLVSKSGLPPLQSLQEIIEEWRERIKV
jgi:hypothetical protein